MKPLLVCQLKVGDYVTKTGTDWLGKVEAVDRDNVRVRWLDTDSLLNDITHFWYDSTAYTDFMKFDDEDEVALFCMSKMIKI